MLIFTAVQWTRLVVGLSLPDLPLTIPSWYLPMAGGVWGLLGLAAAFGLFGGRSWAPNLVRWGTGAFFIWYWADRLLLARSDYALRSWPLAAALSAGVLVWITWSLRRPAVRAYFRENPI